MNTKKKYAPGCDVRGSMLAGKKEDRKRTFWPESTRNRRLSY